MTHPDCSRCGHPWGRHFETGPLSDCLGQPYSEGCDCDEYWAEGSHDGLSATALTDAAPQPDADPIVAERRAQL